MSDQPRPLPVLRHDLDIFDAARDWDGAPRWVVFDPARNKYFQIDRRLVSILRAWAESATVEELQEAFSSDPLADDEVDQVYTFLNENELLEASVADREKMQRATRSRQKSLLQTIVHGYLFFRIPLIRPDRILDLIYPRMRWLFSPGFHLVTALTGVIGLFMVMRNWSSFVSSFNWFFTPAGMLTFALILVTVKIIHELGHALTCKHYGLRVPTMGVAFMVMWPVLYTDASDGWRLRSRHQRAWIDAAGVMVELGLACYALFLWSFAPDGYLRSALFVLATTTVVLSLVVNLNPLMRFDGYYFLSDILNVPNLQDRSFKLGKWNLRRRVLGVDQVPPEQFQPRLQRFLIGFAYAVWVYRFFLFLGIALLVYHMFFKALGVVLFLVEIWWFIIRPMYNEVRLWPTFKDHMSNRRRIFVGAFFSGLLLLFFLPTSGSVVAPAVIEPGPFARIFPPQAGMVRQLHVAPGDFVEAGSPLVSLDVPELQDRIKVLSLDEQRLRAAAETAGFSGERLAERLVLEQQLAQVQSAAASAREQLARSVIRAPFAGHVVDVEHLLHEGRWVASEMHLMTVASSGAPRIVAWLDEEGSARISPERGGYFYPVPGAGIPRLPVEIIQIESAPNTRLERNYHAAPYGGELAAEKAGQELEAVAALYRAHIAVTDQSHRLPRRRVKGWVYLETERVSPASRFWRWAVASVIREAGF